MDLSMPEKIICPFCDSIESEYWHTNTSMADHLPYKILRCRACKSAFVSPYPTEEYLNQFYSGEVNSHGGVLKNGNPEEHLKHIMKVEKAYPNSSIDAERIASLCKSFSLGNDFLDIGAGYGFFTKAAKAIGFNCKAIEAGSNNCNVFRLMNGFEPLNQMFDEKFSSENRNRFDVVLLSQVLEHIPNPQTTIKQLRTILKPGGICVIAVPHFGSLVSVIQGKNDMFIIPPEHLNFFSIQGLNDAFKNNGFSILLSHTISRYDQQKLQKRIKPLLLSKLTYSAISSMLNFSDLINRGMFINSYFRKE